MTLPEDAGILIKYKKELARLVEVRFEQVILKMELKLLFVLGEKFICHEFPNGRKNDW
jgi:hypothetical protein